MTLIEFEMFASITELQKDRMRKRERKKKLRKVGDSLNPCNAFKQIVMHDSKIHFGENTETTQG